MMIEMFGNVYIVKKKTISINTSKTHLKNHTISCLTYVIQDNSQTNSSPNKPMAKEEVDNSIIDLVIGTGLSFNVLNSLLFHKMVNKLQCVTNSYKIPHSTTISCHLSGDIYEIRLKFIKETLAKVSGRILLTCDGLHSTVHRCHYTVVTGSWILISILVIINQFILFILFI